MKRKRAPSPKVQKPQSLLVLHLDSAKLRQDNLHLGDIARYSAGISTLLLGSAAVLKDTTTLDELQRTLADFVLKEQTFDVIVAVAHSNATGIRIAPQGEPGSFVSWEIFANYLKPLQPRRLLLAACQAGRSDAGEALFKPNRKLLRIFACPVNASKDFATLMLFAIPYIVAIRAPTNDAVLFGHLVALGLSGRQLREWQRRKDKGNPESVVFDILADLFDPHARRLPGVLRSMIKPRPR